ncbi:MAG TPA: hypothetical protein VI298_15085 [Geobacteraceae bacterium]
MTKFIFISVYSAIFFIMEICSAADISLQTGMNFDWWADNKDNHATQLYAPLTITGLFNNFSFKVLTAYMDTHLNSSGVGSNSLVGSSSLDHLIDTKLNLSYAIIDKLPVDILIGLDFNLPTGKTDLSKSDLALLIDPDLISINNYGEGFNVNPTITFAKEWGKWAGGAGFGYLWRGSYDFSSATPFTTTDYQPGDIFNVNAELRYYFSPALHARFFGSHAWYGTDTAQGSDFFQAGDFSQFGLGINYNQEKKWDAGFTFRGILRDKSNWPGTSKTLSQGDEWIFDLAARYLPNEKTALRSFIQGRYFTENDSTSSFSVGKREKLSFGVGATRELGAHYEAGLDIKGFVKHDDATNFPPSTPPQIPSARDFQGFSATLMLTAIF